MLLSPCPYCGEIKINTIEVDIQKWSVVCDACQASGPMKVTKAAAIQAWESVAGVNFRIEQS
jgi:Lar family restriction alleviation protein